MSKESRIVYPNVDTERVAALFLRWFGPQAAQRAHLRAQDLKKCADMSGYFLWLEIERAIQRRMGATVRLAA